MFKMYFVSPNLWWNHFVNVFLFPKNLFTAKVEKWSKIKAKVNLIRIIWIKANVINLLSLYPVDRQNPDLDSGVSAGDGNEIDLDKTNGDSGTGKPTSSIETNSNPSGNEVFIMDNRNDDRTASFFAQPGILAGKYLIFILNLIN